MTDRRLINLNACSGLGAAVGMAVVVLILAFHGQLPNAPRRAALTALHQRISLGDDYGAVQRSYFATRIDSLDLHLLDPDHWQVHTPLELGAQNWCLWIDFRDGRVVSVRMRSDDGPQMPGSPPDKGEVPDPQHVLGARY